MHQRGVYVGWKPLLWFVKGDKRMPTWRSVPDVIDSLVKPDKIIHPWQQSEADAEHIIKYLTVEGQVVLDPFLGSGTTAIVARKLCRPVIGIENNKYTLKAAEANIATELQKWQQL
jgi:DNA modification methylase